MRDFWYQDRSEVRRIRLDNVETVKLEELKDYRGWRVVFLDSASTVQHELYRDTEKEAKEMFGIIATKLCGDNR